MKFKRTQIRFGPTNLKRHLGLPFSYLEDAPWWGRWMDHYKLVRVRWMDSEPYAIKDYVMLVSEPYAIDNDGMQQVVDLCKKYGLLAHISGNAEHNSGCCRIEIYRKYW